MRITKLALILGALACMGAGVAMAQTQYAAPAKPIEFNMANVTFTLYGDFDEYLNYMRSSSGSHLIALEDGAFLRTRLGLKGLKDVGDGYYMKFVLEQGLFSNSGAQADTTAAGVPGTTGRLFDRQAWVGVDTPYGEFRAGRQNTAIFFRGDYIDFTTRTLGSAINTFGVPSRYDSDLSYISHRIEGYLSFLRSNNNTPTGPLFNGGSILGNTGNLPTGSAAFNPDHFRIWQVSADYRIIPKVRMGGIYGRIADTSAVDRNANLWVVGAYYDVFRDTMLYGLIDALVNAHHAGFRPAGSAGLQTQFGTNGPASDVNGQSIRGVQVGLVYRF